MQSELGDGMNVCGTQYFKNHKFASPNSKVILSARKKKGYYIKRNKKSPDIKNNVSYLNDGIEKWISQS